MRNYSNFNALSPFHPSYGLRGGNYYADFFAASRRRRYANFAVNPFGLLSRAASVGPALVSGYRAQKKMKGLGSNLFNRFRGGAQHGIGKYLEGVHDSTIDGALGRAAYKGGRSALRSVKNAVPGAGRAKRALGAASAFGKRATSSLGKSASGFALNTLRSPLASGIPNPVSDATKLYKSLRPKGFKLPGARRAGSLGGQIMAGVRRSGSILGFSHV